jgi:hypothetical protein
MALTMLVPYVVSASASVSAMLDVERRDSERALEREKEACVKAPEGDRGLAGM